MNFQSNPNPIGDDSAGVNPTPSVQSRPKKRNAQTNRTCSMCEKPFDPATSRCLPFCSVRCQQLDLGKWMTESYGFPLDGQEDIDHEAFEE